jgi:hypothetical protein
VGIPGTKRVSQVLADVVPEHTGIDEHRLAVQIENGREPVGVAVGGRTGSAPPEGPAPHEEKVSGMRVEYDVAAVFEKTMGGVRRESKHVFHASDDAVGTVGILIIECTSSRVAVSQSGKLSIGRDNSLKMMRRSGKPFPDGGSEWLIAKSGQLAGHGQEFEDEFLVSERLLHAHAVFVKLPEDFGFQKGGDRQTTPPVVSCAR